jgi:hypothetical protein
LESYSDTPIARKTDIGLQGLAITKQVKRTGVHSRIDVGPSTVAFIFNPS